MFYSANDAKTFLKHFSDCLFYFCSTCADSIRSLYIIASDWLVTFTIVMRTWWNAYYLKTTKSLTRLRVYCSGDANTLGLGIGAVKFRLETCSVDHTAYFVQIYSVDLI